MLAVSVNVLTALHPPAPTYIAPFRWPSETSRCLFPTLSQFSSSSSSSSCVWCVGTNVAVVVVGSVEDASVARSYQDGFPNLFLERERERGGGGSGGGNDWLLPRRQSPVL